MELMDIVTSNMGNFALLFAAIFAVGSIQILFALLFKSNKRSKSRGNYRRNYRKKSNVVPLHDTGGKPVQDAAEQLRRVMEADFKARPLLNKGELRLFKVLEQALETDSPGWRAMGQVSLGEVLSSRDKGAYFAINSKRVDMLIVDADYQPLHAVEFQGKGHHWGKNTAARDAVKKEALRRAGIGYVEVVSGDTPAEVKEMVRKLVGRERA